MNCMKNVSLTTDDELGRVDLKRVKLEQGLVGSRIQKEHQRSQLADHQKSRVGVRAQDSEDNRSSNALSTSQSSTSVLEQVQSPVDDTGVSSSSICPAPLCRQFWKAGDYSDGLSTSVSFQSMKVLIIFSYYPSSCPGKEKERFLKGFSLLFLHSREQGGPWLSWLEKLP